MLLALVVLGPEKLPEAMRKLGSFVAQVKKMSSGFQAEFRAAVDEPMREMRSVVEQPMKELRDTANLLRDSADFRKFQDGERAEKPKSAEMSDVTPDSPSHGLAPADPDAVPTPVVPFQVDEIPIEPPTAVDTAPVATLMPETAGATETADASDTSPGPKPVLEPFRLEQIPHETRVTQPVDPEPAGSADEGMDRADVEGPDQE